MENKICSYCSYEWSPRKSSPKSCPRCKRRFDYLEARTKIIDLRVMLKEVGA